jgi:multidrug efflux pump subunit AcrB
VEGVRNELMAGWYGTKPAVLIIVFKQANANVIDTVDQIRALAAELKHWIPEGIKISFLTDRTITIRAGFEDLQLTMLISVILVMLVVLVFLRRTLPTVAAGIAVPLSLAGTLLAMWALGFSLDNLSLMALTVSIGFVVDDAIVMIENAFRNIESGLAPREAAIAGARQIGFTVASISVSLIAAFIPLLFMGGIVGRLFREFSATLVIAIAVSAVVSLTVTPMICAHFRAPPKETAGPARARPAGRLSALALAFGSRILDFYRRTLGWVLRHSWLMLGVTLATVAVTVFLYAVAPKGFFPVDDTGMIMATTESSADVSFKTMEVLQEQAANTILADSAVERLGSFVGASGGNSSINQGRLFITLKPLAERRASVFAVIDRLRRALGRIPGMSVFMTPMQDLRIGARASKADYQYTLWDTSLSELTDWLPRVLQRISRLPGFLDVSTDREAGGLQTDVIIDRGEAARLGVSVHLIDDALGSAFSQRQLSTMYTERNQYHVILEVEPQFRQDPTALSHIFVPGASGAQMPLSAVARFGRSTTPLVVNHQGQFPAITLTFNLAEGTSLSQASAALTEAFQGLHVPDTLHGEFAGTTQAFQQSLASEPILIVAALITMYIILGVLYESLLHPITILSTLPSAGIGALLALRLTGTDLTLIALVGVILLMGIVKKNGIMLVDFALEAERERGLPPEEAILEASLTRFRPIMMTTMAALFGAIPLILVTGNGAELRRPLGITIVGGLLLSQLLTLYTTPVIYLLLDRLSPQRRRRAQEAPA